MASTRNKRLIRRFGGRMMPFRELPVPAQLAIAWYMAVDGEAWELPPQFVPYHVSVQKITREFRSMLPWFRKEYGSKRFGYVEIPTDVLTDEVMEDVWMAEDLPPMRDFEEYHRWYVGQKHMPDHPATGRWPVILSGFEDETLQDGWHRLHDYYRKGAEMIPAVYYP